ncbi:MAG TPA: winged helix-turn-helix transcriptional regulator [Firmicutes bacterium]|nr:winged helix-turn-helix transcriptional regulator [Bacillota bacterium]
MLLQYVAKHGRITRREAAELCRLSPDQAYRLLTRLTEEGQLARHGTKKGAWYERRV